MHITEIVFPVAGFLLGLRVPLLGTRLGIVGPILSPKENQDLSQLLSHAGFFRTHIWGHWVKILLFALALSQDGSPDHEFTVQR